MKVSQFTPVPKVKVLVTPEVLMEEEVLVIIKLEVMEGLMIAHMPPKVEHNVPGVMTNGKPKSLLIKDFE
jgi:hypothetical protein